MELIKKHLNKIIILGMIFTVYLIFNSNLNQKSIKTIKILNIEKLPEYESGNINLKELFENKKIIKNNNKEYDENGMSTSSGNISFGNPNDEDYDNEDYDNEDYDNEDYDNEDYDNDKDDKQNNNGNDSIDNDDDFKLNF